MEYFTYITGLSALAVVAVQQILKLKFVPLAFANKYPVPTNILLSIAAAVIVVWQDKVVEPTTWPQWVALVAVVSVVAAIVYNQLIGKWKELRETEGEGTK